MDNYIEVAVSRKNNIKDTAVCFVSSVLPLLIGTYVVILCYVSSSPLFMLSLVFCALMYFLAYKLFCMFNVDWEYTLVGNELRFSKIINKNKRRELLVINFQKIDVIARTDDTEHNYQFKNNQSAKLTLTSQTSEQTYFLCGTTEKGKKVCIEFEPDSRMLDNFATTMRGKFFE
ncbi:MAG: hypothetical protein IJ408_00740 [Clostridia bacterium]|nr:hypothetical protein [Clostridia bacterium]